MSYDDLADAVAELPCDGIEATVRQGGLIEPARAADDLPRLVEALAKRKLQVTILTTDVLRADEPHTEPLLRTAAQLGITRYRTGFYRYDLRRSVLAQLDALRPVVAELAALNRQLGVQALYQNHSGAEYVGSTVWDIFDLIRDVGTEQIALAFDIRHATVEAGLSWPTLYNAMRAHIAAVFVKDFDWEGRQAHHVPLGTGRVDPRFFRQLRDDRFVGPISLHVEYERNGGPQANLKALRRDLAVLREWLAS